MQTAMRTVAPKSTCTSRRRDAAARVCVAGCCATAAWRHRWRPAAAFAGWSPGCRRTCPAPPPAEPRACHRCRRPPLSAAAHIHQAAQHSALHAMISLANATQARQSTSRQAPTAACILSAPFPDLLQKLLRLWQGHIQLSGLLQHGLTYGLPNQTVLPPAGVPCRTIEVSGDGGTREGRAWWSQIANVCKSVVASLSSYLMSSLCTAATPETMPAGTPACVSH